MAAGKTGATVKAPQKKRMLGNDVVGRVMYNGRGVGHGKYMAGEVNGKLVCDANGVPMKYETIGVLM